MGVWFFVAFLLFFFFIGLVASNFGFCENAGPEDRPGWTISGRVIVKGRGKSDRPGLFLLEGGLAT